VALAEDRDRRADGPAEGNRCYAERAPRQRDLSFQADYCYSQRFSSCSVFLGWAARNAAEPAYVSEAAQRAWREGIGMPDGDPATVEPGAGDAPSLGDPTPETGLFGLAGIAEGSDAVRSEQLDWVSASAWAEVPWDERAELEADEFEVADPDEEVDDREEEPDNAPSWSGEEATQAPKVPAAVPIRKRKRKQPVIRSR
jgi:hypothetical protein